MGYNFLVLGAGLQGSAAASILSRSRDVERVYLVDIDGDMLRRVVEKIGSDKVIPLSIDVRKLEIDDRIDITLNFLPPRFNIQAMEISLRLGSYYVDTASGPDENLRPVDENVLRQFKLDDKFRDMGIGAVISSGATPGLTNVYARKICETYGVEKLILAAGIYLDNPPKLLEPVAPYMEILFGGWNLETAFLYRATKPVIFDGEYKRLEPYANPKYIDFEPPLGVLMTVLVDHEEPITLPRYTDLKYVEYRNLPDYMAYGLIKYGFADMDLSINIDGYDVKPYEVLKKLFPKPANYFLQDTFKEDVDTVDMERVVMIGVGKEEVKAILDMEIPPRDRETRRIFYDRFGTTYIYVALPAIVSGILAYEENIVGVHAPEYFQPDLYIKKLGEFGYIPSFKVLNV